MLCSSVNCTSLMPYGSHPQLDLQSACVWLQCTAAQAPTLPSPLPATAARVHDGSSWMSWMPIAPASS